MDPLLLELPVRASEAAALAEVVFQQLEGRRLNDDLRNRAAGRATLLGLETISPYMGSLQSDPIHPNCYFIAIDGVRGGIAKPYLLRLATASAPSSGLFQNSILIGRMRPGGGREIVINAVAFGPDNPEMIQTFAREVDRGFLPKPAGSSLSVASPDPEAFSAFKSLLQDSRLNVASCACEWHVAVWRSIRAGWREGYAIPAPPVVLRPDKDPLDEVLALTGYTKLILDVAGLDPDARKTVVSAAIDAAVKANASQQWSWRRPDIELSWLSVPDAATEPDEIATLLGELRESGRTVQAVSPTFGVGANAVSLVEAVRAAGAVVSISSDHQQLEEIAQASGGRLHCTSVLPGEDLRGLVKRLRTT